MKILIDGYNLLHETSFLTRQSGDDAWHRARQHLIAWTHKRIQGLQHPGEVEATIVFDAARAPTGLPAREQMGVVSVYYAVDHPEADDLILELIRSESAPRQLCVVSSDHRIQRAALRRQALVFDSGPWYDQLELGRLPGAEQLPSKRTSAPHPQDKPLLKLSAEDLEQLRSPIAPLDDPLSSPAPAPRPLDPQDQPPRHADDKEAWLHDPDLANPFPDEFFGEDPP